MAERFDIRAATALSGAVLVTSILAAVLLSRHARVDAVAARARRGRGSGRGGAAARRRAGWRRVGGALVAALAMVSCLAAPAAYSIATAATPHSGAIPSVGPSRHGFGGGSPGPAGCWTRPSPGPRCRPTLAPRRANDYTWAAAVVGSNNAAGYQLASGAPVMAVGGFNGTDPAPTLEEFQHYVAAGGSTTSSADG